MKSSALTETRAFPVPDASAGWRRLADRMARYSWLVLLVAVILALVGSTYYAATWVPAADSHQ